MAGIGDKLIPGKKTQQAVSAEVDAKVQANLAEVWQEEAQA